MQKGANGEIQLYGCFFLLSRVGLLHLRAQIIQPAHQGGSDVCLDISCSVKISPA
jgi:hypothetical protein